MPVNDKRKNPRFDLELPVTLKIGKDRRTSSETRNISASGALVPTDISLPEGATLEIDIDIPSAVFRSMDDQNARMTVKGRVVRVDGENKALVFDGGCQIQSKADTAKQDDPGLTLRQKEILKLIARGCSNKDIADELCISPLTVKTHLQNIFSKLNVKQRLQAALWATENL